MFHQSVPDSRHVAIRFLLLVLLQIVSVILQNLPYSEINLQIHHKQHIRLEHLSYREHFFFHSFLDLLHILYHILRFSQSIHESLCIFHNQISHLNQDFPLLLLTLLQSENIFHLTLYKKH